MQKLLTPLAIIIAGLVIAGSNLYINGKIKLPILGAADRAKSAALSVSPSPSPVPSPQGLPAPKDVPIGNSPTLGEASALVTVVEFSDFQCPFCAAAAGEDNEVARQLKAREPGWEPAVPNLIKDYVDKGLVRFVYKDFAFLGEESVLAANAAWCAQDQGKFWPFHDMIFASQKGENQGSFKEDKLKKMGAELGLDSNKFNDCVTNRSHLQDVQNSTALAKQYGVSSTPTFFVNNQVINGAVPFSTIKEVIENELTKLGITRDDN